VRREEGGGDDSSSKSEIVTSVRCHITSDSREVNLKYKSMFSFVRLVVFLIGSVDLQ
jgi:hypothetical protein